MGKIKVLCVTSGLNKESLYGIANPNIKLAETNYANFDIDITSEVDVNDKKYFEQFDIVLYHRCIGMEHEQCKELLLHLKNTNTKTVCYVDEYWMLPRTHRYRESFIGKKFHEKIINNMRLTDYILTPSKELLPRITKINSNVTLVRPLFNEDAIKYHESRLRVNNYSERMKFGLLPSKYDKENIKLISNITKYLEEEKEVIQFVLCGFSTKGIVNQVNKYTGEVFERLIRPQDTVWAEYERIITNDYKICSPEYKEFLLKFLPNDKYTGKIEDEMYKRVWELPIKKSHSYFEEFDILLDPKIANDHSIYSYNWSLEEANEYNMPSISINDSEYKISKPSVPKQWSNAIKQCFYDGIFSIIEPKKIDPKEISSFEEFYKKICEI